MAKWTVEQIQKRLMITRNTCKGRRGNEVFKSMTVDNIRNYCDEVDFLLRTIAKLEKKSSKK